MNCSSIRLLSTVDAAWFWFRQRRAGASAKTNPGVSIHSTSKVSWQVSDGIVWPHFKTFGHSLWRAQEATLFRELGKIESPCLDLGCGDGIFAEIAGFPPETVGFDCDSPSLEVRTHLYPASQSVMGYAHQLPFADNSFASVLSNSVLEHLPDLILSLHEIYRVLKHDGQFTFTMTLGHFTKHLETLCGRADAAHWVNSFGHNQEPTARELYGMLQDVGFKSIYLREYQPIKFTRTYRRMVSPAYQWLERKGFNYDRRQIAELCAMVRQSITGVPVGKGACAWVTARK